MNVVNTGYAPIMYYWSSPADETVWNHGFYSVMIVWGTVLIAEFSWMV